MTRNNDTYLPGAATMVFLAAAILLLPWLGDTLFNSKGEPREAIVAVSMLQSGDWLLPLSYGADMPYKPPFMAWMIAAFAWLFNGGVVNEYISRLPSALAAIAMIMTGYRWAEHARGPRFAMIFSFVTLTCVEVFRAAVACRLDMVLTACMVMALYMLFNLDELKCRLKWLRYIGAILLLSIATMTKGPVGALLPCFIYGVYRLLRGGKFFTTLGLTGTMSYDSHVNPWWYNFMTLAAGLLPWTVLILASFFAHRRFRRAPLSPAALLSLTAASLTILFYCIPASKRSVYLLPAYPFICYGIASILDAKEVTGGVVRFFTWFISVLAVLVPVAVIAAQFVSIDGLNIDPIPWWRYIFILLPIAIGLAWMKNRHSPVGHLAVAVWSLFLTYSAAVMPAVLNPNSDKDEAAQVEAIAGENDILSLHQVRFYTMNFYLGDRIRGVDDVEAASAYPSGTVLLVPSDKDTTGLSENFTYELLTHRGSDYRRPVGIAIKK